MATILLVEDEASMRLLTCAKLKNQFTMVCAKDGVEALELLERQPVDLIIADVMMPRMDGLYPGPDFAGPGQWNPGRRRSLPSSPSRISAGASPPVWTTT